MDPRIIYLCALEMGFYYYFISQLPPRFECWWRDALLYALFTFALSALTQPFVRIIYDVPFILGYYALVWLCMRVKTRISLKASLFYIILLYLTTISVKHVIGHISIVVYENNYLVEGGELSLRLFYPLLLLGGYIGVYGIIRRFVSRSDRDYLQPKHLLWMIISIIPILAISDAFSRIVRATESEALYLLGNTYVIIEVICGICALVLVVGIENMLAAEARERELLHIESLLQKQSRQYMIKREAAEMVDHKYHDLKNHLLYLASIPGVADKEAYIRQFYEDIRIYESVYETGSQALDIIASEKHALCQEKNLQMLLFADGEALSFLSPMDISTLFGNALDNAIESAQEVRDPAKREIVLRQSHEEAWLVLRFENHFEHDLHWTQSGLATTKADEAGHGYGLKSIRHVAEKYGGHMTAQAEDDLFILNILLPLEGNAK